MAVAVNKEKCIGCAACTQICSRSFQLGIDGKAEAIEDSECASNAAEACPVQAISVE